ncbi:hypothetical protein BD626DRAFT_440727 [Schizophyllum amplum]|uniref:Uncharacterized protein n=1 Tax=Schizophyllum amplum TaxID=97359 RepID=A0A550BVS5_9AGAR|nr:hypothetical protein BD626DRAFT_440727 [Auriculariopsis ampla]
MAPSTPSAKVSEILQSVPPEAREQFIEKYLLSMLDRTPKEQSKKVLSSAARMKARYATMPTLDLKGKQREMTNVLEELTRDSKRAFLKERSNRDELLEEAVETIVGWLSDIWQTVYEFKANYAHAHTCLLWVAEMMAEILNTPVASGCKCAVLNMPVTIPINRLNGKTVKTFSIIGLLSVDHAILWIWRELFVSMFAANKKAKKLVPQMLADIEEKMGWSALERILTGGLMRVSPFASAFGSTSHNCPARSADPDDMIYGDLFADSCLEEDEDSDDKCNCALHAAHWSDKIDQQRVPLREAVETHLVEKFKVAPSEELYHAIIALSGDPDEAESDLLLVLDEVAGSTPDTLVAAINIHADLDDAATIVNLLDSHGFLLRGRDYPHLQAAVSTLTRHPKHLARGLAIIEQEMNDTMNAVRAATLGTFTRIDDRVQREELGAILKLRTGSQVRKDRVERWVSGVTGPGGTPHPVALAAMLMGLPFGPGPDDGTNLDAMDFVDLDPSEDEELRPHLKERFEGWQTLASSTKGGQTMLLRLYTKMVDLMPFFRAQDVVDEMINYIMDRPSKAHVCDALEQLSNFCKMQRKRLNLRQEKRRRVEESKQASQSSHPDSAPTPTPASAFGPFTFSIPLMSSSISAASPAPPPPPLTGCVSGMEDVD